MSDPISLQEEVDRIAELHQQVLRVQRLQEQAQAALLLRMKFKLDGGAMDMDQVTDVYMKARDVLSPGFHDQLKAILGPAATGIYGKAHHKRVREAKKARANPNGPGGTWVGTYPFDQYCPMPPKGTPVVYFLYDAADTQVYAGSSSELQKRLVGHARQGKVFVRWSAVPCSDREAAYKLEDQLLRDHKLPLNVRAGR
ncbi:GIY-YIG nuclease family protein [Micromonospora haikouensis]|uniref:GIY-YIG nuclease family protein n=1 Tax=Micromonospora haikouensis TaxID=686309 RepID=UPI0036B1F260